MSACAMLTYNNVTSNAWNCGVAKARSYGVTISGNSGSASSSGFTVAWNYNPDNQTLSLQCTDSPWYVPCSIINSQINTAVEQCLDQHQVVLTSMVA